MDGDAHEGWVAHLLLSLHGEYIKGGGKSCQLHACNAAMVTSMTPKKLAV